MGAVVASADFGTRAAAAAAEARVYVVAVQVAAKHVLVGQGLAGSRKTDGVACSLAVEVAVGSLAALMMCGRPACMLAGCVDVADAEVQVVDMVEDTSARAGLFAPCVLAPLPLPADCRRVDWAYKHSWAVVADLEALDSSSFGGCVAGQDALRCAMMGATCLAAEETDRG